jgi:TPR repeat protein
MVGGAVAGPLEDAKVAYDHRDYDTALRLWRPLADQGNAEAQKSLGNMYYQGQGVAQNYPEALKWYHLAVQRSCTRSRP